MTQIWYILLISKIITHFINVKKVRQRFQILHDTHKCLMPSETCLSDLENSSVS